MLHNIITYLHNIIIIIIIIIIYYYYYYYLLLLLLLLLNAFCFYQITNQKIKKKHSRFQSKVSLMIGNKNLDSLVQFKSF